MSRLRVASVCSGIGGAELAFDDAAHVFASEIEPFPRAVLRHHYPDLHIHGDFTTIQATAGPVDVLVGGTPCQSFSVAGLRGGMADERGNLALEYLRLADRLRPTWVLWENVPGVLSSNGGRDFGAFVGGLAELGYGWAYRCLDAQHFGLAQRRQRVFVVGCLGDWRRAVSVLFEPSCLRGHPAPSREAGQRVAGTVGCRAASGTDDMLNDGLIAATLRVPSHGATWRGDGCDNMVAMCLNAHGGSGRIDAESETFIAYDVTGALATNGARATDVHTALRSRAPGHSEGSTTTVVTTLAIRGSGDGHDLEWREDGLANIQQGIRIGSLVRRLTPTECERLQGFPDGWTDVAYRGKPASDGPRYRALGNAFAVPVVRWIARRIAREHADMMPVMAEAAD